MNCPNCVFKNVDSMRFCPECGENIEKLRHSSCHMGKDLIKEPMNPNNTP